MTKLGDELRVKTAEVRITERNRLLDFNTWLAPFLKNTANSGKNEYKIPDNYYFNEFFDIEKLDNWCQENALKLVKRYRSKEDTRLDNWYELVIRW